MADPVFVPRADRAIVPPAKLRDYALSLAATPVSRIELDQFGTSYEVVIWVDGLNGERHPVVSAWFVNAHVVDAPPRLVSAYVRRS